MALPLSVPIRVVSSAVESVFREISQRSESVANYIFANRGFRHAMFSWVHETSAGGFCDISIVLSPWGRELMHRLRLGESGQTVIMLWDHRN